jgi:exopolyphosphatase/guanosine-5'-triphosphate,3'-diphosphate pyrophosphatase
MTRVGAVDCGTNSIRLLIADADRHTGQVVDVDRRMEIVRLGEGVDRTGVIAPEAMARTLAAAERYGRLCREAGVERIRFAATSATRDARNRGEFVAGVRAALGVEPEVISGTEEAELSFVGATGELIGAHPGPYLVVDLGGGSTELVLGDRSVEAAVSLDVGCVRFTERHLHADPPTPAQIAAAVADVRAMLDAAAGSVPLERVRTLVGLAGSVTTVAAYVLGLSSYDSQALHRSELPVPAVLAACDDLLAMPRAKRARLPYMHPGRVDVIGAGALVWREIVERVAAAAGLDQVVVSEHDILDGLALSIA